MLRIHFTTEDIARTTLTTTIDPLWEVLLSRFSLTGRERPLFLQPWMARLRSRPDLLTTVRPAVAYLTDLAPLGPYFPDFLTPAESAAGLEAGIDAVRATSLRRLRDELAQLSETNRRHGRATPSWLAGLTDSRGGKLAALTAALREYHRAAVGSHDDLIRMSVENDVALRVKALLAGGVEALFRGFEPLMRWRHPVLEVSYAVDRDLHLRGRGLRLVPSYFCHGDPVSLANEDLPPVLVYPIAPESRWESITAADPAGPLADLMGATRAAVLVTLRRSVSTTQLATQLYTSIASMSRHTKTLRQAGLITSTRSGPALLHNLTPLGWKLLDGSQGGS
ncbi:transcriptional regulator [Sphaerisporangium rufum]|uniref:Transcriptional regulator n=1 Tax=Sphaerisporangium rufum TaxID=1381558 RepID=A0A919QXB1_9ACTN|nr:helix-turn-helix domain-containing protein [Sphaerisporangium rufum]GII75831.1 transcriptional regulator [Sphaerisporangium rufum]